MITRYDLAWWNGARIAIVRMDTPDQRFSTSAKLDGYVVLPAGSQQVRKPRNPGRPFTVQS
jgi:hypothetical protein